MDAAGLRERCISQIRTSLGSTAPRRRLTPRPRNELVLMVASNKSLDLSSYSMQQSDRQVKICTTEKGSSRTIADYATVRDAMPVNFRVQVIVVLPTTAASARTSYPSTRTGSSRSGQRWTSRGGRSACIRGCPRGPCGTRSTAGTRNWRARSGFRTRDGDPRAPHRVRGCPTGTRRCN
jgi:hypothetical protein